MEMIFGTIVKDGVNKPFGSGKSVVNFTIALNDPYHSKSDPDKKEITRFVECQLWNRPNAAKHLVKGKILELFGMFGARAFNDSATGKAVARLTFTIDRFNWKGGKSRKSTANDAPVPVATNGEGSDDLPF